MGSKQMKRIVVCVFTVIGLLLIPETLHAQDNYVKNGDFEKVASGSFPHWKVSGKVKTEAVSGAWQRLTCKFRSGVYEEVNFFFIVTRGSTGSVWIDRLMVGPQVQFENPSFEELDDGDNLSGWRQDNTNVTVFSDSTRASDGKKSVRITHAHDAVPMTRIWQKFPVEPGKEYTLSFDMFVGDDFQGEAKGWMFDPAASWSLDFDSNNLLASNLVVDRDRFDRYVVGLSPMADAPAGLSQDLAAEPNANLQASIDLDNRALKGTAKFTIEDAGSGRILKESTVTNVNDKWQSVGFSFQSASPKLRVRIMAEGVGILRVDNVAVTCPRVVPPLQHVQWLPASKNFSLPSPLKVLIQGPTGQAIEGGLTLLNNDLKPYGIVAEKSDSVQAPLQILVGSQYEVKGRGDESYALSINTEGIAIKAGKESGAFYGLMTLLQLIEIREGKPVVLSCAATDYPDMPLRGVLQGDEEQAARWKMNTTMYSTGNPTSVAERKELSEFVQKCKRLNLKIFPYFLSLMHGWYVARINPNLAAGIWVKDEPLTLRGSEPSPLANRYVIRTGLTDVKLKSPDGKHAYVPGTDYQVINGDMAYPFNDQAKAKPFAVARLPGSSIPDGGGVLASYDYVSHYRASDNREDAAIPYCPLEPEVRKLMEDYVGGLAKECPYSYGGPTNDLEEFRPADSHLETDSRVINSGKKPIELLAEDTCFLDKAAKQGNPAARLLVWAGHVNEYTKAAGPFLPKDALILIWGYDASWPTASGREAVEYWTKLGFTTSVMPWNNLRNVRGWAQVVAEATRKGYPCIGMIDTCWSGVIPNPTGGVQETAIVSWKIPKAGERGFVALPKTGDVKPKEASNK